MKNISFNKCICIIAFLLGLYGCWSTDRYLKHKKKAEVLETTITNLNQAMEALEIEMNDSITLHAGRVKALTMSRQNLEAYYSGLLKAANIKAKNVQSVTDVTSLVADKVDSVPVYIDRFGGLSTEYRDAYTRISVCIDSNKVASFDYSIRDSLTILNTQKKHSILFGLIKWSEVEQTTVVNSNPKATIANIRTINVMR